MLEPRTDDVGDYVWGTVSFAAPDGTPADSVVQFVGDDQASVQLVESVPGDHALHVRLRSTRTGEVSEVRSVIPALQGAACSCNVGLETGGSGST